MAYYPSSSIYPKAKSSGVRSIQSIANLCWNSRLPDSRSCTHISVRDRISSNTSRPNGTCSCPIPLSAGKWTFSTVAWNSENRSLCWCRTTGWTTLHHAGFSWIPSWNCLCSTSAFSSGKGKTCRSIAVTFVIGYFRSPSYSSRCILQTSRRAVCRKTCLKRTDASLQENKTIIY